MQETSLAKQTLNEMRERHDEFIKLEGTILELNTMFQVSLFSFLNLTNFIFEFKMYYF